MNTIETEIEQFTWYRAGNLLLEEHAAGYKLIVAGGDSVALTGEDLTTLCALVNHITAGGVEAVEEDAAAAADPVAEFVALAALAATPVSRRGIKAWAREQGWWVSERGRVTDAVIAAFDAAHGISA